MTVRLFGLLLLATGIVWVCGMALIYSKSLTELERVLDGRLEEATRMVSSLMENAGVHVTSSVSGVRVAKQAMPVQNIETSFHLACQIWSVDGRLVGKSSQAPMTAFTNVSSGYSDQVVDGKRWRVFARENPDLGIRVLVGDSISHRERLERSVTAFAAHELRTPLAGLRTQVQIAMSAADPEVRFNALRSALAAADR